MAVCVSSLINNSQNKQFSVLCGSLYTEQYSNDHLTHQFYQILYKPNN